MVRGQGADAHQGLVLLLLLGGPVAARRHQPMQGGEEHGTLGGELELALAQQLGQHRLDAALPPQALKEQGGTDDASTGGEGLAVGLSSQDGVLVREAAEGAEQGSELAGGEQLIQPAQTVGDALLDLALDPLVLDQDEVGAVTVGLGAEERGGSCVSSP
jgi:hypothetical protein